MLHLCKGRIRISFGFLLLSAWFAWGCGGEMLAAVLLANTTETKAFILFAAVLVVAILGFAVIFGPHHRPPQNDKKDEEKENG